jgi:hypothetical protein
MWSKSQGAELKRFLGGHASAAPIVPTTPSASYVRKYYKTKITVGRMGIRLGWLIQVQIAPRRHQATRMQPPRTILWEVILGEANFFDKVGAFR